ncbi:ICOS ligand-like isoform X2 [Sphaeramia orbicularis]|nr:ICOS ligand-like isoform X2 [Sphaeramia orbicularis]XP_029987164.1 ICOS ligand-like isoform X2 [Sphaeramia orbicularis]
MPVALWRTGLLLCFLTFCASLEEECVLGVVGRPVLLPCFHPEPVNISQNASVEWRKDQKLVLRAKWEEDGDVVMWSLNSATISPDALITGNFSLELPKVDPKKDNTNYSLSVVLSDGQSVRMCTVCLKTAASFSFPQVQREEAAQGNETVFLCQSSGGFPEPAVYWLINDTEQPPEGSVKTRSTVLPDSVLYNITSHLTVQIPKDYSVSCSIQNQRMNETLTSKSSGAGVSTVRTRASEGMWIFSTALCVVVGVMVIAGVAYQIHLDRISKRRRKQYESQRQTERGYKRRNHCIEETEVMTQTSKETDV